MGPSFYLFLLYFSSNSLPSRFGSSVNGSLQYIHMSTRPSILVCFPQFGQTTWTVLVESIPIQKYTTTLAIMNMKPKNIKIVMSRGEFLKKMPMYMTINPTNINARANVRILLILLEYIVYLAIHVPP